jgi:hypothetical protein
MIVTSGAQLMSVQICHSNDVYIDPHTILDMTGVTNDQRITYGSTDKFGNVKTDNVTGGSYGMIAFLGTGNAPVTKNDYCLNKTLVGGVDVNTIIQCVSARSTPLRSPKGISYIFTFFNSGEAAIEIKEICLAMRFNAEQKYMIARKVIPTRLVQAGETITFSYELNLY